MYDQHESAEPFELWQLRKGNRQLRCVAVYLPSGVDLRRRFAIDVEGQQLLWVESKRVVVVRPQHEHD
jgi:hypothetical protein